MMVLSLFIIVLMGLFFYNKIGSIIPMVVLPTTEIIEPEKLQPGEDQIGSLLFDVQSNENSSFKVVKVPEAKSISLDDFDEVIGSL